MVAEWLYIFGMFPLNTSLLLLQFISDKKSILITLKLYSFSSSTNRQPCVFPVELSIYQCACGTHCLCEL